MRLNGWQRIGIVASTLWLLGGSAYAYEIAVLETGTIQLLCIGVIAVMPIILGWLFVWLAVLAVRWVCAGFSLPPQP